MLKATQWSVSDFFFFFAKQVSLGLATLSLSDITLSDIT